MVSARRRDLAELELAEMETLFADKGIPAYRARQVFRWFWKRGIADFEAFVWYGYQGPANLPRPVLERLNGEIVRAAELPDVRERMVGLGLETMILTPEPFGQFIARDLRKWAEVVKAANIKAQ